mmetsp:Transcript_17714/g.40653  ORF Transcript_17714/g.40653 Transcript_17714/m.40653 type:complete len:753 (+) Transcript_17714:283-2541(+)
MTMQRRTSSGNSPDNSISNRSTSGGLGALSAAANGSSSSPAAVAAATTALGLLTGGGSSLSGSMLHPDFPPSTSLSRNGSLSSVGLRSSSSLGSHGLWGLSSSSIPLLSPSELAEAADVNQNDSLHSVALLAQMRQRIQEEQQQEKAAESAKKRSRDLLMDDSSDSANKKASYGSALGAGNASSLSGFGNLLSLQGGGNLGSSLSGLGGSGGNNLAQIEQLFRKQQLQQMQQMQQRKQLEEMQRLTSSSSGGSGSQLSASRENIIRENAILQLMLQQQQQQLQQNGAANSLSSLGGANSSTALEAQIKALQQQQRQQQVHEHLSNNDSLGNSSNRMNGDKQRNKLSPVLGEAAVRNFMAKNSAKNGNSGASASLGSLSTAQIQQMMASRQLLQQNQQQQQNLDSDGIPLPPSLVPAVSSMDSISIMQMLLPKNRQKSQSGQSLGGGNNASALSSALMPSSLSSTSSSSALASQLSGMGIPSGQMTGLGFLGGLSANNVNGLSGMIGVPRHGSNVPGAKPGMHLGNSNVSLHPSASDLIYEQQRLAAAAEVSNTVRDSTVGKPADAFIDRDPDGRARDLPTLLVVPMDHMQLSSHQTLLRYQIEVFRAGEEDTSTHTRGRNKPVQLGQIGIRCRHCKVLPVCRRKRGSVYFPRAVEGFYQAAQNMNSTHLQTGECPLMGEALRREFANLIATRGVSTGAGRAYWAKQARKLGLRNTENGIVFDKTRPEQREGGSAADSNGAKSNSSNNPKNSR